MASVTFDMAGFDAFAADMERAAPRTIERARQVVKDAGDDTVYGAQSIAPYDYAHVAVPPEHLRDTISADFDADGLGFVAGPTARHGAFLEFGTSRMPPQPYLLPVFDLQAEVAVMELEQVVADQW